MSDTEKWSAAEARAFFSTGKEPRKPPRKNADQSGTGVDAGAMIVAPGPVSGATGGGDAPSLPRPFTINKIRSAPAVIADAWPWSAMNGTEARFAREFLHGNARVIEWHYESINLRLGGNLHYRPDFFVVMDDGRRRFVEVKGGYVREDAEIKFKAAAMKYTLLGYFEMWQYTKKGGWVCVREI